MKFTDREHNYNHPDYDGKWMDIDQNSGGYPYPTDRMQQAYIFSTLEEALSYQKMFPYLDVFKLTMSVEPI